MKETIKMCVKVASAALKVIGVCGIATGIIDGIQNGHDEHRPYGFYEKYLKRMLDFICSACAVFLLSPVYILVAVLIRIKLGSPVIFKQERPGKNDRLFKMYKFRTMLPPQTKDGRIITDQERLECVEKGIEIMTDEERLTKFGRLLRSFSVDELPELWNVVKGDMSLVGPRPLAVIYLPYYSEEEKHRHDVRPGLTGLAQVHGRNSISWEERFEHDLEYVGHISLLMDLKILIKTVTVVFSQEDIGQGEEKPEPFNLVRQRERMEESE